MFAAFNFPNHLLCLPHNFSKTVLEMLAFTSYKFSLALRQSN